MDRRDTGKVNINRNPDVPEGSALPYPTHKVLGIMPKEEDAWQAIDDLKLRGFSEEEIELWTGPVGSQAIEGSYAHSGIIERLKRLAQKHGEEGEFIRGYDEALQKGGFLLVVPATTNEAKMTIRDIMVKHGGHLVSYFDHLTMETLT